MEMTMIEKTSAPSTQEESSPVSRATVPAASNLPQQGKNEETQVQQGVRYPEGHQLFVGNIPHDVHKAKLKEVFEKYGTVLKISIKSGGMKVRNFGFVTFSDSAPVQNILSNRPIKLHSYWRLNVEEMKTRSYKAAATAASGAVKSTAQKPGGNSAVHNGPRPASDGKRTEAQAWGVKYPDAHQLFVGKIPQDVHEAELKEFFESYGTVLKLSIKSGKKVPNFGSVVFDDSAPVQKILSDRPIMFREGVCLNVEEMKTKEPQVQAVRYPDAHQLFVGKIPHDVSKAELREVFEQYGTVLKLSIKRGGMLPNFGGMLPNFGFVVFNDSAPVQKILSSRPITVRGDVCLNVEEMKTPSAGSEKPTTTSGGTARSTAQRPGGPSTVHKGPRPAWEGKKGEAQAWGGKYPDSHQLFVGKIPHDVQEAELKELFEKYGAVLKLTIKSGGNYRNFGFVVFSDSAPVQKILGEKPVMLRDDVFLNVEEMKTRETQARVARYPDAHQLFVGNIPHGLNKAELKEFFEQYGTVLKISIKRGGTFPNFGFVAFDDSAPVQKILSNGSVMLSGEVCLNVEEMKTTHSSSCADKAAATTTTAGSESLHSTAEAPGGTQSEPGLLAEETKVQPAHSSKAATATAGVKLREEAEPAATETKTDVFLGTPPLSAEELAETTAAPAGPTSEPTSFMASSAVSTHSAPPRVRNIRDSVPIKLRGDRRLDVEEVKAWPAHSDRKAAMAAGPEPEPEAQEMEEEEAVPCMETKADNMLLEPRPNEEEEELIEVSPASVPTPIAENFISV